MTVCAGRVLLRARARACAPNEKIFPNRERTVCWLILANGNKLTELRSEDVLSIRVHFIRRRFTFAGKERERSEREAAINATIIALNVARDEYASSRPIFTFRARQRAMISASSRYRYRVLVLIRGAPKLYSLARARELEIGSTIRDRTGGFDFYASTLYRLALPRLASPREIISRALRFT